jgi:hypothetical protein
MYEVIHVPQLGRPAAFRGDLLSAIFHALTWSVLDEGASDVVDADGFVVCAARSGRLFVDGAEVDVRRLVTESQPPAM